MNAALGKRKASDSLKLTSPNDDSGGDLFKDLCYTGVLKASGGDFAYVRSASEEAVERLLFETVSTDDYCDVDDSQGRSHPHLELRVIPTPFKSYFFTFATKPSFGV